MSDNAQCVPGKNCTPNTNPSHIRHHDFEFIDEITLKLQERWKEAECSGDEWRFCVIAKLYFKGEEIGALHFRDMESAMQLLYARKLDYFEKPNEENIDPSTLILKIEKDKCSQPGCKNIATKKFMLKYLYSQPYGEKIEVIKHYRNGCYLQFCEKHYMRGDCGLQDADHNYEK